MSTGTKLSSAQPLVAALLDAEGLLLPAANETLRCGRSFWPGVDEPRFCLYGQQLAGMAAGGFNQYDLERQLLNRWVRYPRSCKVSTKLLSKHVDVALADASKACLAHAHVLIAATPIHEFLRHPERWLNRSLGGPGPAPKGTTYIPLMNMQVHREMPSAFAAF